MRRRTDITDYDRDISRALGDNGCDVDQALRGIVSSDERGRLDDWDGEGGRGEAHGCEETEKLHFEVLLSYIEV